MVINVPGSSRILTYSGKWERVSDLVGEQCLVSYENGAFTQNPAVIANADQCSKNIIEYRTGSYRILKTCSRIEILSESEWHDPENFRFEEGLSTYHILERNKILVPRRLSIFGNDSKNEDWARLLGKSMARSRELAVPYYLTMLDQPSLVSTLKYIIKEKYPKVLDHIARFRGKSIQRSPALRLTNLNEESRRLLVHLFARLGIRTRRWEDRGLIVKDKQSKDILYDLLDVYHVSNLNRDTTVKDWIWVRSVQGPESCYTVETDADNLCDGVFIWRQKKQT